MARVLLIEDEPILGVLLTRLLSDAGYQTKCTASGVEGLQAALTEEYDLVILDLLLPDISGEEILHVVLAARSSAKVIVVSSIADVRRRVSVLERGAKDFIAKPFVNADLLARVRLRIQDDAISSPLRPIDREMRLDTSRHELVIRDQRIPLSQREYTLLAHLVNHKGQVCSRQELLSGVWGIGFDPGTNVVDVYVGRLRAKLEASKIETIRNVGYRFVSA